MQVAAALWLGVYWPNGASLQSLAPRGLFPLSQKKVAVRPLGLWSAPSVLTSCHPAREPFAGAACMVLAVPVPSSVSWHGTW